MSYHTSLRDYSMERELYEVSFNLGMFVRLQTLGKRISQDSPIEMLPLGSHHGYSVWRVNFTSLGNFFVSSTTKVDKTERGSKYSSFAVDYGCVHDAINHRWWICK